MGFRVFGYEQPTGGYWQLSEYATPNCLVLFPCCGTFVLVYTCDWVRKTFPPFNFAKYLSYEPCFISTPLLPCIDDEPADEDPGRINVIEPRVELPLPRRGTLRLTTPGTARSLC